MIRRPERPTNGAIKARHERGLALLSALLSVALLTLIVVEMTDATLVNTHFARNAGNAVAAHLLARSAEEAGKALLADERTSDRKVTHRGEAWAVPILGFPAGPGTVGLSITDEQGKLNLNALGGPTSVSNATTKALVNLFTELGLDSKLVGNLVVWIKPSAAEVAARGERDYCLLAVPCEPRHAPLVSVDELRVIRGFDARLVEALRPYVTALPDTGAAAASVNLNTARGPVLRALGCEVGDDFRPPDGGFKNETDARDSEACRGAELKSQITVKSSYFSIVASGTVGDTTQSLLVLVKREAGARITRHWWRSNPAADLTPGGLL